MDTLSTPVAEAEAEAARYALLRRLAPSMRHHLVVNLQPIGMIHEVMERRLRAPQPDLAQVQDSAAKINGFARAALDACLDVVTWLAPDASKTTGVAEGVRECFGLLASSLSFRGYALRNETGETAGQVRRAAIRNVLTATLIHATDEVEAPAELVLGAQAQPDGVLLMLELRPSSTGKGFMNEPAYRRLAWSDVQALAAADQVEALRDGERRFSLFLPWAADAAA
jgi:hypothetical protein